MGEKIALRRACDLLLAQDDILILAHENPDGDTLGSAFALLLALQSLGKRARVECADAFPARYAFLLPHYTPVPFEPRFIVAVDIADRQLFGLAAQKYVEQVDLCIDHHPSNALYARETLLDAAAAATAEMIAEVLDGLGVVIDKQMATCIYTGISTDTGCFRFSNATARTHRVAARMMELGVDSATINREMFSSKTKSRIAVEREVYNTIEYHSDGRCALVCLPRALLQSTGADETELDGVSSIPCQIVGVEVGVTLREKEGGFKVSLRTNQSINASDVCARLGGGGHARASGCFIPGELAPAKDKILKLIDEAFALAADRR